MLRRESYADMKEKISFMRSSISTPVWSHEGKLFALLNNDLLLSLLFFDQRERIKSPWVVILLATCERLRLVCSRALSINVCAIVLVDI